MADHFPNWHRPVVGTSRGQNHDVSSDTPFLGVDDLTHKVTHGLEELTSKVHRNEAELADFGLVERLIASLPLSTSEFAVALLRLINARTYCLHNERGAAVYELRLLQNQMEPRCTPGKDHSVAAETQT